MTLANGRVNSVYSRVLIDVERLVVRDAEGWIDHVRIQRDRLREQKDVLVEEWHLDIGMSIVEVDRALKISVRGWKDEALVIKINHYSAGILQRLEGCFDRVHNRLWRRHEWIKSI